MNSVQKGKGDRPRNNWGPNWYAKYDAVDWCRRPTKQESHAHNGAAIMEVNGKRHEDPDICKANNSVLKRELSPESISS